MPLFDAEIAEIVRCQKKDDEYIDEFTNSIRNLAQKYLGPRKYVRWEKELSLVGPLAYYAATTVCGLQTLGEEYVGLIEIFRSSNNRRSIPSLFRRLSFILLQVSGPYFSDLLLSTIRRSLISRSIDIDYQQFWIKIIDSARRDFLPGLQRFHLAVFYIFGRYYHLSKRVSGVTYASLRSDGQSWDTLPIFRWLGYLSILQILSSSILWFYSELINLRSKRRRSKKEVIDSSSDQQKSIGNNSTSNFRCQLCLEEGKAPACAPCGHPFCWDCLLEHVVENRNCPVCRSETSPSRIIPLMNI